ncbi:MAG: hypothetical protein Q4P71_10015 [Actinomycetaceae bacterium]|nr:hypothetical protein [Actinomycetaceae bacterium]
MDTQDDRPVDSSFVRTTLVHRRRHGTFPWWHTAAVAEIPGVVDELAATMLSECMFPIARAGFTAVAFRPALIDLSSSTDALARVIDEAHRVGLKVLVRLSGADHRPWEPNEPWTAFYGEEENTVHMVVRARAALKAGADGIDMGLIEDAPEDPLAAEKHERFSALARLLQAELLDFSPDHILGSEARVENEQSYSRHLKEEWFHHLRDNRLQKVPFDARALETEIAASLYERDRLGSVPAWKATRARLVGTPGVANNYSGSWEDGASPLRRSAMRLVVAALPGTIYLPFGFSGGHVEFEGTAVRPQPAQTDSERMRVRHTTLALRIRAENQLATGSFAFVSGLEWQKKGVSVAMSGGIMAVLNTTDEWIDVSPDNQLLVRSDSVQAEDLPATRALFEGQSLCYSQSDRERQNRMAPETTAWFKPQLVNGGE